MGSISKQPTLNFHVSDAHGTVSSPRWLFCGYSTSTVIRGPTRSSNSKRRGAIVKWNALARTTILPMTISMSVQVCTTTIRQAFFYVEKKSGPEDSLTRHSIGHVLYHDNGFCPNISTEEKIHKIEGLPDGKISLFFSTLKTCHTTTHDPLYNKLRVHIHITSF